MICRWRIAVEFFLVAGLIIALSACGGSAAPATKTNTAAKPSVFVKTIHIKRRSLVKRLTAYGTVEPNPSTVQGISAAHGGAIAKLWVGAGERVAAGARLLELITQPSALKAYEAAKAQVAYAKGDLAHTRALYKQHLATNAQLASAEKALATAKAELKAQTRLGNNQAKRVLRAPYDGIVTAIKVSPGDRVAQDTTLMTLIPQGRLWVRLGIEPEDLNLLSTGTPVVLTPVFNHRIKIHANLTQVHATVDPATHLMDAIVALKGRKAKQLAPGMPMHGVIEVRRATMLAVPRSAVLADGHGSYIFIVRNGHGHKIYVKTAFAAGQWIGIQGTGGSKLKPGARVVVTGNYELHDGMAVRTARS